MEKIIFTNGCFDLLHIGHIRLLDFCKNQGGQVIVGLNSDHSIRLQKPGRPIFAQNIRKEMLYALHSVDRVTIFSEITPQKLIEKIRPAIIVKGEDWKGKKIAGEDFVKSYGGKVLFFPLVKNFSTTLLLEKIRKI